MKKILSHITGVLFLLLSSLPMLAQTELDALRHSQYGLTGTARVMGMGGAYSAVGADLTSATLNPAGLGLFRSSTFSISPVFRMVNNQTEYLDYTGSKNVNQFGLSNWGLAFNNKNYYDNGRVQKEVEKGLVSYTFAFGSNQLENYKNEVNATAYNELSSITQMWAERSQGTYPSNLPAESNQQLAFDLLLIDTVLKRDGQTYFSNPGNMQQTLQVLEEGRRNEWFVSLAGNFNDFIYIGGTIGIQSLKYEQTFNFNESDINRLFEFYDPDPDSGFPLELPTDQMRFTETFSTNGVGINGKFGVIIRPGDYLRMGISAQTPTFFNLTDEFNATLVHSIDTDNGGTEEYTATPSSPGRYTYNLKTPFKVTAGLMYMLQKNGLLSIDVEYTDISSSTLSSGGSINDPNYYSFSTENNRIANLYKPTLNLRAGGEFRMDIFRFRVGGALFGTPLTDEAAQYLDYNDLTTLKKITGDRLMFTAGAGIRQPNFYMDVTLVNQQQQNKINPYSFESTDFFAPTVINQKITNSVVMSVGFNF
ncbi:MAG: hypothetical protein SF052_23995 [Bacteroidia bacterium]|nr:hypothetical protein [Bacteroidia bacterium]